MKKKIIATCTLLIGMFVMQSHKGVESKSVSSKELHSLTKSKITCLNLFVMDNQTSTTVSSVEYYGTSGYEMTGSFGAGQNNINTYDTDPTYTIFVNLPSSHQTGSIYLYDGSNILECQNVSSVIDTYEFTTPSPNCNGTIYVVYTTSSC